MTFIKNHPKYAGRLPGKQNLPISEIERIEKTVKKISKDVLLEELQHELQSKKYRHLLNELLEISNIKKQINPK